MRREKIGFVFQGYQLLSKLTAADNVAFPLMLRGVPEAERARRAARRWRAWVWPDAGRAVPASSAADSISRVAVARALCYSPRLLLCDEPTGALDVDSRNELLDLFDQLHLSGHTVVLITHDPFVAARADRRYRVEGGLVREG